jgi:hypothetical protein
MRRCPRHHHVCTLRKPDIRIEATIVPRPIPKCAMDGSGGVTLAGICPRTARIGFLVRTGLVL